MKMRILAALLAAAFAQFEGAWAATTTVWTNTSGGNWSVAANWSPNQAPGIGDIAEITTAGTYTVTNNQNTVVASFALGSGSAGVQSLQVPGGGALTFTGGSTVNGNGVLAVSGGGVLSLAGGLSLYGLLTNAGTVNLTNNPITILNNGTVTYQGGLVNLAGGALDFWGPSGISGYYGQDYLINQGQMLKNGSASASTINLTRFDNGAGTVTVQTGTMSLGNFVGILAGTYNAAAGTTIQFFGGAGAASALVPGAPLALGGAGQYQFTSGYLNYPTDVIPNLVLTGGTLGLGTGFQGGTITNLTLAGMDLAGTNAITGKFTATNGTLRGTFTVAAGGVLTVNGITFSGLNLASGVTVLNGGVINMVGNGCTLNGGGTASVQDYLAVAGGGLVNLPAPLYLYGPLTNAGTINLTNNSITIFNNGTLTYQGGLVNLAGGTLDFWGPGGITGYYGQDYLINQGQMLKSLGVGTTTTLNISRFTNQAAITALHGVLQLTQVTLQAPGSLNVGLSSATDAGQIALGGNAALAGTFSASLNNGYVPAPGDYFSGVTYGSFSGQFSSLHLPAAVYWQTRYDTSALKILAGVPQFGTALRSGTNWVLRGSAGLAGNGYRLLTSTDLFAPLANWIPLVTNIFDINNRFSYTNSSYLTVPQQFYCLQLQLEP